MTAFLSFLLFLISTVQSVIGITLIHSTSTMMETMGFGRSSVTSRSRVPLPPHRIITGGISFDFFISVPVVQTSLFKPYCG